MAVDLYNFSSLKDMGQPFPPLGRQTVDGHAGLEMARHHVVPNEGGLKKLWDKTLVFGLDQSRAFMVKLHSDLPKYKSMLTTAGGRIHPADLTQADELVTGIMGGTVAHSYDSQDRHPGFDTFWQIYCWLPGNLFEGPKVRADDPGEKFDNDAGPIVGQEHMAALREADKDIQGGVVAGAWEQLAQVTHYSDPVAFRADQWIWDQQEGEPRIRP